MNNILKSNEWMYISIYQVENEFIRRRTEAFLLDQPNANWINSRMLYKQIKGRKNAERRIAGFVQDELLRSDGKMTRLIPGTAAGLTGLSVLGECGG